MGGCCSRDDVREEGLGSRGQVDGEEAGNAVACPCQEGSRTRLEGSRGFASMFTQQGLKGVNQDAMVLVEDFGGVKGTVLCGIFDGHGPYGHKVAAHVRDNLPHKLDLHLTSMSPPRGHRIHGDTSIECRGKDEPRVDDDRFFCSWKDAFTDAFEELDKELGLNTSIDCICSGTTAVCVMKHRENLLIANLGDSRAVLGTRDEKNKLVPIQLTVDLKPNLPGEAERINSCQGRVFALKEEPDVHRIWLPDDDCPGLAMARAFGDFCLKDYGLISTPQLSSWKLTEKDEFVILANRWGNRSDTTHRQLVNSSRLAKCNQLKERSCRYGMCCRTNRW
ncbi:hypothetical protein HPP92_019273 [Vanilla planifolia]|uniref:protein-serine/threonine phosphatase n=1 Tax=Vanilla planifolia TaxID=51239 RepID=A0A835Q3R2_VANPL|nr:hypothetical protein HPP92_019273 [Vanilla planifolia]